MRAVLIDLTDSKEGSPPTCSSLSCTTCDSPLCCLFSVFGIFWVMLKVSAGRPLHLWLLLLHIHLVPSPSEPGFRGMSVGGSFRRV